MILPSGLLGAGATALGAGDAGEELELSPPLDFGFLGLAAFGAFVGAFAVPLLGFLVPLFFPLFEELPLFFPPLEALPLFFGFLGDAA